MITDGIKEALQPMNMAIYGILFFIGLIVLWMLLKIVLFIYRWWIGERRIDLADFAKFPLVVSKDIVTR